MRDWFIGYVEPSIFSPLPVDMAAAIADEFRLNKDRYMVDGEMLVDTLATDVSNAMHVGSDDDKDIILLMCQAFVKGMEEDREQA